MDFLNEYGLLIAVATPVVVILAMNVLLALSGERGTLLLPSSGDMPSVAVQSWELRKAPPAVPTVGVAVREELLARKAA